MSVSTVSSSRSRRRTGRADSKHERKPSGMAAGRPPEGHRRCETVDPMSSVLIGAEVITPPPGAAAPEAASGSGINPAADAAPVAVRKPRYANMGVAVGVLAVIALVGALYLARAFVVPLLIGILASYALHPVVDWLKAGRVPRAAGAALV